MKTDPFGVGSWLPAGTLDGSTWQAKPNVVSGCVNCKDSPPPPPPPLVETLPPRVEQLGPETLPPLAERLGPETLILVIVSPQLSILSGVAMPSPLFGEHPRWLLWLNRRTIGQSTSPAAWVPCSSTTLQTGRPCHCSSRRTVRRPGATRSRRL